MAHVGAVVAHLGAVVGHVGAVVAHCRSSGSSLVVTPDCETASWVRIQQSPQPTVDCQSLAGLPTGMALHFRLSSEWRQENMSYKNF